MIVKAIWNECAIALFCHGKKTTTAYTLEIANKII